MTTDSTGRYVPAAGRHALTGLYDAAVALTMREERWRPLLCARVLEAVPAGGRVADVGAGTGTLAIEFARLRPDVCSPSTATRTSWAARSKAGAGRVRWQEALASELPLDDDSADAIVTSLLLHHLGGEDKDRCLRVLRPGGYLHVADWGRPRGLAGRAGFFALRLIDGFEGTRDHAAGRLRSRVEAAGFADVTPYASVRTVWGRLEVFSAAAAALLPSVVTLSAQ